MDDDPPVMNGGCADGTLEAIVAHGLIGSLSVATGSASMLLRADGRIDAETEAWLVEAIRVQSTLVVEGMKSIGDHAQGFADAATNISLAAGSLEDVRPEHRKPLLEALLRASDVLRQILGALVRGLPPDVIDLLDELSAESTSTPPAGRPPYAQT
jgi:hypothetical protein